jgi:hypothetical protein
MQDPPPDPASTPRAPLLVSLLIATVVGPQVLVTSRVLCPPQALAARGWPRIACPPRLWPFVDYPMFSSPHPRGDTLAWVDAHIVSANGVVTSSSAREVQLGSAQDTWEDAFARTEQRLRDELEPGLPPRALHLSLERHRLVLDEQGLVPCADCPEVRR